MWVEGVGCKVLISGRRVRRPGIKIKIQGAGIKRQGERETVLLTGASRRGTTPSLAPEIIRRRGARRDRAQVGGATAERSRTEDGPRRAGRISGVAGEKATLKDTCSAIRSARAISGREWEDTRRATPAGAAGIFNTFLLQQDPAKKMSVAPYPPFAPYPTFPQEIGSATPDRLGLGPLHLYDLDF